MKVQRLQHREVPTRGAARLRGRLACPVGELKRGKQNQPASVVAVAAPTFPPRQQSFSVSGSSSSSACASGGGLRQTLVIGGFGENTRRCNIENALKFVTRGWEKKIEAAFALFKRGPLDLCSFTQRICGTI